MVGGRGSNPGLPGLPCRWRTLTHVLGSPQQRAPRPHGHGGCDPGTRLPDRAAAPAALLGRPVLPGSRKGLCLTALWPQAEPNVQHAAGAEQCYAWIKQKHVYTPRKPTDAGACGCLLPGAAQAGPVCPKFCCPCATASQEQKQRVALPPTPIPPGTAGDGGPELPPKGSASRPG